MKPPHKQSPEALQEILEDQIEALDKSAIVAMTDPKGKIIYVNQKFCELSEYTEEELIGKTHRLINSGVHESSYFEDMWKTIQEKQVWRGEICNKAKSGRIYWVDTTIVPFMETSGDIEKYVAIRYEITDRKLAEQQIEVERKRMIESEKMASIGLLSAGIAHELGNPLGAIRGRLEMLLDMLNQENMDPQFASQSVDKMIQSVDRISKIIRALKGFSRDGSNDEKQEFNLIELIDDIVELSKQKCSKSNIEIRQKIEAQEIKVMGRETEIGQIIVNLFNNAYDAAKDSAKSWIEIEVINKDSKVVVRVQDSGSGVPEDIAAKIFDPFYTTKDVGKGTGLGLSLCRSFAEHHGGVLKLNPEISSSCFQLELPRN